ncbi:MAG: hypothetical protein LKM32_14940 [Chiayiivirga sp.]|uniref:hypothetical protein n=1 Tax=Chiayiivirga sp. TaxID=2041042 RepID=UPI0025C13D57|nr:hypothetical protein [Chiayiivirga sp.]MCI1730617.1 hypothetical protein [Chiayiivirga sp.]
MNLTPFLAIAERGQFVGYSKCSGVIETIESKALLEGHTGQVGLEVALIHDPGMRFGVVGQRERGADEQDRKKALG